MAANVIAELGKPTAGAAGAGGEGFSLGRFMTNYNQLSPRGRDILFGSTGGGGKRATTLKAELDNLAEVIESLRDVEKGANASKTLVNAQAAGTVVGLITPEAFAGTTSILGGMALTGELLTNPVAVRWLVQLGRAQRFSAPAVQATLKRLQGVKRR